MNTFLSFKEWKSDWLNYCIVKWTLRTRTHYERCNLYTIREKTALIQCKKCTYSDLSWSAFSRFRTEYGEIRSISPYLVRMGENADQNISEYGHFLGSVSSIEVWMIWYFWHENWALFTSNCSLRNRNNSNSKTYLLFLSVIEDIYLLLITCLSHSCYRRYIPFVNNMPKSSML